MLALFTHHQQQQQQQYLRTGSLPIWLSVYLSSTFAFPVSPSATHFLFLFCLFRSSLNQRVHQGLLRQMRRCVHAMRLRRLLLNSHTAERVCNHRTHRHVYAPHPSPLLSFSLFCLCPLPSVSRSPSVVLSVSGYSSSLSSHGSSLATNPLSNLFSSYPLLSSLLIDTECNDAYVNQVTTNKT